MTAREGQHGKLSPRATNVDRGEVFEGWQFPMLHSRAVNIYYIILNVFFKYIVYITLVSKQSRASEDLSLYFVLRTFKRSYDASLNLWWTVRAIILHIRYFLEYHSSSSNSTLCQETSRVRAWFHDSAGDIDFYKISLSQSESTILHESIIFLLTVMMLI